MFDAKMMVDLLMCEQMEEKVEFEFEALTPDQVRDVILELEKQSLAYFTMDEEKEAMEKLIKRLNMLF